MQLPPALSPIQCRIDQKLLRPSGLRATIRAIETLSEIEPRVVPCVSMWVGYVVHLHYIKWRTQHTRRGARRRMHGSDLRGERWC